MPSASDIPRLRRSLLAWHRRNGLRAPWRTSGDPYMVLVAAVMAQQTQMSRVLPKFDEFMAAFPTVEALARATTARVLRLWAPLGYNLRALRLQRAARRIARAGGFARTAAELERIEGIGPFTAAIIASFAFGEPVAAVDTNVRRVLGRLVAGDVEGRLSERALQPAADRLVAPRAAGRWNQAMMDLGGTVCTARAPRCHVCPLAPWCRARPLFAADRPLRRAAEAKAPYRVATGLQASRRYYRGRIVQALRELPAGASLSPAQLLRRVASAGRPLGRQAAFCPARSESAVDRRALRELLDALRRDGLVRVDAHGRVRLP